MNALAIDLGSTACKASVISLGGDVLGSGLMRIPTTYDRGGLGEQDPEVMWESTLTACRQALAAAGTAAATAVRSICVSSQWMSIVPVDAKGLPVAPLHMWFDRRGEQYTEALTAGDDGEEITMRWEELHGFGPSISLSHILWFHHHNDIHCRTAAYLEPMDYLKPAAMVDPKIANAWKTKAGRDLSDAELLAMPDSEYMGDKQTDFFRARLKAQKDDLLSNAGETTEHLREDTSIVPDPADRATIEEEHALELRTRDRERKLLKKVAQALTRLDTGEYGFCDETGEPIGLARLLARPTATLSLEAQQRREMKQKMFGD